MNNIFKGKIKCLNCNRNYNFKLDHNIPIYICSGYKNYRTCPRNQILQTDLINIALKHLKLQGRAIVPISDLSGYIDVIYARVGYILIKYKDGSISEWKNDRISF